VKRNGGRKPCGDPIKKSRKHKIEFSGTCWAGVKESKSAIERKGGHSSISAGATNRKGPGDYQYKRVFLGEGTKTSLFMVNYSRGGKKGSWKPEFSPMVSKRNVENGPFLQKRSGGPENAGEAGACFEQLRE